MFNVSGNESNSPAENLAADIVIVGGGVAGLGAAIALAAYGMQICVIERRAQVGGIHRGDSLLPKSVELLSKWGLRHAIMAAGAKPIFRMEIHAPESRHVMCSPITQETTLHPYLVLPHARLEGVLMDHARAMPNVRVVRPASFIDLVRHETTGRACGVRYRRSGAVETIASRLIVAADGQHSAVRKRLNIDFAAYHYDHAYLGLEASRPDTYEDAMRIHFHAEGGVLLMPHPHCVGVGMLVEAGSAKQWLTMDEPALLAALCKRAPVLHGMALNLRGAHVYELTRAHASHYQRDGVALIGDAAHCTNPTAGQGMAMALTDAGALAEVIGSRWNAELPAIDRSLSDYEARQRPKNKRLIAHSHWLAIAYALRGRTWTNAKLLTVMALASRPAQYLAKRLVSAFTR